MLRRRKRELHLIACQLLEYPHDILIERAAVASAAELRLPGRTRNRHGRRAIGHQIAWRDAELDSKVRVSEACAVNHPLCGIIVDVDAFELVEEAVAIADSGADPAGRLRFPKCPLHSIFAQGMRTG